MLAAAARLDDHYRDGDSLPVPRMAARRLAGRWSAAAHASAAALGFDTRPLWQYIRSQEQREKQRGQPLDYYAEPTAFCFGEVFAHTARLSQCPENIAALRQVGRAFGKQVFLLDAVDDREEDARRGRFNPLLGYDTAEAAYQAAAAELEEAQAGVESHLAQATMPRPDWVRPVLTDFLRHIGRQRFQCATSCSPVAACASTRKSKVAKDPEVENRQRFYFCMTSMGMMFGLVCGGCCGAYCANCERETCCKSSGSGNCDCRCNPPRCC